MQLTVEKKALSDALGRISACVGKGQDNEVLGHVLLDADSDGLTLGATDLVREIRLRIPAQVAQLGARTADAKLLKSFVTFASGDIRLEYGEKGLSVRSGRAVCQLPSLEADSFPSFPAQSQGLNCALTGDEFLSALRTAANSCEESLSQIYTTGVSVAPRGDDWIIAATNGKRLVRIKLPAPAPLTDEFMYPYASACSAASLFEGESVDFFLTKSTLTLTSDSASFTSKLVAAVMPNYERLLLPGPYELCAPREELLRAYAIVSGVESRIGMSCREGALILKAARVISDAAARDEVPCEGSFPFEVTVGGKFLGPALRFLCGERVTLFFGETNQSVIVLRDERPNVTSLVQPMN